MSSLLANYKISQKLNEFNTRDKYFYSSTSNLVNSGVNKIKTYDDFSNELLIYIKSSGAYFTRAGYVESYDYSSLHTGLAVDIYDSTSSKDEERINFWTYLGMAIIAVIAIIKKLCE